MKWLLLLLLPIMTIAQDEKKMIIYNVGFGGLSAGIGSVINKKDQNWRKTFLKGFWQGSIGGALNYYSRQTMKQVEKNHHFSYAIPARIINCAGNSIIVNAAFNEPFLTNWFFEYAIFRFDYSTKTNVFRGRILPEALFASALALHKGKFDLGTTLQTGVMSFISKKRIELERTRTDGINYGRAFIVMDTSIKYHLVAHELIHEFQYREYLVFNTYFKKPVEKMNLPVIKKIFSKYLYADIPYFGLFYLMEGIYPAANFTENYFEWEAEYFAK